MNCNKLITTITLIWVVVHLTYAQNIKYCIMYMNIKYKKIVPAYLLPM